MTRTGFNLLHYHGKLYEMFTGDIIDTYGMPNSARVAYNSRVAQAKQSYGLETDDVKHLILFCFVHNPLMFEDLRDYGKIDNVLKAVKRMLKWWAAFHNTDLSVEKTIWKTRPTTVEVPEDKYFQEMQESFTV